MLPLVSILIPCYNAEQYLTETLDSCISQDYSNIEVIFVDDGSSDNSYQIAKRYESDKVKVYKQENSGACRARNLAFEKSSGEYIMYLDADDLMTNNKVSEQIRCTILSNTDEVIFCRWTKFEQKINNVAIERQIVDHDYDNGVELLLDLLNGAMIPISCWLVHRDLIAKCGSWNESLRINQDGEYFARILLLASVVKFTYIPVSYYRIGVSNSITRQKMNENKGRSLLDSYMSIAKHLFKVENSNRTKRAIASNLFSVAYQYSLYPKLYKEAKVTCVNLGVKVKVNIGGNVFRRLCRVFGSWNLLEIRKLVIK